MTTQKDIKRLCAWRKRVHRGIHHDKEVSDSAKAAFRRAAYGSDINVGSKEREDENDEGLQDIQS